MNLYIQSFIMQLLQQCQAKGVIANEKWFTGESSPIGQDFMSYTKGFMHQINYHHNQPPTNTSYYFLLPEVGTNFSQKKNIKYECQTWQGMLPTKLTSKLIY